MKKHILMGAALLLVTGCVTDGTTTGSGPDWGGVARSVLEAAGQEGAPARPAITDAQIVAGLKEALSLSTGTVITQLGTAGGYNLDPKIHIPLPPNLQKVDGALRLVGLNHLTRDLERRMNAAAEIAAPKTKALFVTAVTQMTFTDARAILFGGQQDAATQYFRRTVGPHLVRDITPIVERTLADAGAIKSFDAATAQYNTLPVVGKITGDAKGHLNSYVTNKAVDGLFYYIAQEEIAIRRDPVKRTTELLKTVFGRQ
jgi:hypothetical protein